MSGLVDDPTLAALLPDFLALPAGHVLMGTPAAMLSDLAQRYGGTRESYREESPQHLVPIAALRIARVTVTHALYAAYVAATGVPAPLIWRGSTPPPELQAYPVVDISWDDAQACCAWLSHCSASVIFRLPTEAEWEYAARGDDGRQFPWGDTFARELANTRESAIGRPVLVDAYPQGASRSGLLQMAGNVWEWTASRDASYPYHADDGRENPTASGRRILRGGSYVNALGFARCACRFRLLPSVRNEFLGFRLALSERS
ncbi:MAG: formylglycine-generating enzyme family protein [Chloroflexaceae bacterium]|nr:formylglycine-generating enzyme family protein [Chloroflexaceae bacterium]